MALGLVRQLASGQHMQVRIPSGNYLWPTIRVLNPNDGVVYVKQNADLPDIGFGSWDYKVPSQSFGLLPGEGEGWQSVGMYYLDQSGANRPGEISIYLTQQSASEPTFQSIGRAAVTLSSSVDVASGNQPANPPAGYGRLWIDTGGHLNVLQPTGTNFVELDSTNYQPYVQGVVNATPLGGDLYGSISAAHINVQYNDYIQFTYSGAQVQRVLQPVNTDSYLFTGPSGFLYFWSDSPGTNLGNWNANTNILTVNGNINVGVNVVVSGIGQFAGGLRTNPQGVIGATGDIGVSRGNNSGVIYFGNGSQYIFFDGTQWVIAGGNDISLPTIISSPVSGVLTGQLPSPGLAANAVTPGALAPTARVMPLANYQGGVTFSSGVYGAWVITPLAVNCNFNANGTLVRFHIYCAFNTTNNALVHFGLAIDGAVQADNALWLSTSSATAYGVPVDFEWYVILPAGVHAVQLAMYSNTGGTWGINNGGYSTIYVEQMTG